MYGDPVGRVNSGDFRMDRYVPLFKAAEYKENLCYAFICTHGAKLEAKTKPFANLACDD